MNGEQPHQALNQTLNKLVNRVRNDSIDSLQAFEHLFNILHCLEHLKEPRSLGSDSLLSECIHNASNTDLNQDLNSDSNSELNHESTSESTNESDSGQQSSEEGSTNDLKTCSKKSSSLLDLVLQLLSIIVNHLVRQVHNKQDAELLIDQWKQCLCFKQQQKNGNLNGKTDQTDQFLNDSSRCSTAGGRPAAGNLLINTNHQTCPSLFITSSGIQSDASCSPLSSLTTDCCANLSTCSLSPACYYSTSQKQPAINGNKKCTPSKDKPDSAASNSSSSNSNTVSGPSAIPVPPPPPPMPNQLHHNQINHALDKSMSSSSLNNQLISSFNSTLSAGTPPQSINEVPVILLEAPKPKSKMKTLNWSKISVHKVLTSHKPNIWSKLFSKKDDKKEKKSGQGKSRKSKTHKDAKKKETADKFSSDEDASLVDDAFKSQRRLFVSSASKQRKAETATLNSNNNNSLTKLSSAINTSNSSINSTTTINSTSTASKSKKQSEEDLMNIVQLDFDTLEGLFCQPINNQVNIASNNVGTMIANFSNSNNAGSVPNSCPNSPSTNRRNQIQQQNSTNSSNCLLYGKQANSSHHHHNQQSSNGGYQSANHAFNQQASGNQPNQNCSNLNLNCHQQSNSMKLTSYLTNLTSSSQTNVGQLNKLNNKLDVNGRNSPSANYLFDDRKQAAMKRCSGEFNNANVDYMHNLLDSKRSLNINIFLKQFRSVCSNDGETEIVRLVKQGDHTVFGAEKLLHLIKLLPDHTEIDLLRAHSDDLYRLPLAERFLLQLMTMPK